MGGQPDPEGERPVPRRWQFVLLASVGVPRSAPEAAWLHRDLRRRGFPLRYGVARGVWFLVFVPFLVAGKLLTLLDGVGEERVVDPETIAVAWCAVLFVGACVAAGQVRDNVARRALPALVHHLGGVRLSTEPIPGVGPYLPAPPPPGAAGRPAPPTMSRTARDVVVTDPRRPPQVVRRTAADPGR